MRRAFCLKCLIWISHAGAGEFDDTQTRFPACEWVWGSCSPCESLTKAHGVCDLQVLSRRQAESPTGENHTGALDNYS